MMNRIGSICGILGLPVTVFAWLGISPESVGQKVYDVLYIILPIVSGAFGFLAGWSLRGAFTNTANRPRRTTRKEKREQQKQAVERAERSCNAAADTLMQLNPDDRALFVVLASGKTAYGKGEDWRCSFHASEEFFTQFFKVGYRDGDIATITPTPLLKQLFSGRPDLKEGLSATVDKHRRKTAHDGMTTVVSFAGDQALPYWWWTT